MIVVDTSTWIDAFRRPAGAIATRLRSLLDEDEVALALPVRLELLADVSRRDRSALSKALTGLHVLRPSQDTWALIERWVPLAADKGHRFGLADLVIAALTEEIAGLVWSLDDDFRRLERLKLVHCYDGP